MLNKLRRAWNRGDLEWIGWALVVAGLLLSQWL